MPIKYLMLFFLTSLPLLSWTSQANDKPILPEIMASADPKLLPSRKEISNQDNAFTKIESIVAVHEKLTAELKTQTDNLNPLPKDLTANQKRSYLDFYKKSATARNELFSLSGKPCLVPDDKLMLTHNIIATRDFLDASLVAEALNAAVGKLDSTTTTANFLKYFNFAEMYLSCEGSISDTLLSLQWISFINKQVQDLIRSHKINSQNSLALIRAMNELPLKQDLVLEQIKRDYRYTYLASFSAAYEDWAKTPKAISGSLFNISESISQLNKYENEILNTIKSKKILATQKQQLKWFHDYIKPDVKDKQKLMAYLEGLQNSDAKSAPAIEPGILENIPQNYVGRTLLYYINRNSESYLDNLVRDILEFQVDMIATAIMAHEQKFKQIPSSLDILVKNQILTKLPINDLTNQSLMFDAKSRKIGWVDSENNSQDIIKTF